MSTWLQFRFRCIIDNAHLMSSNSTDTELFRIHYYKHLNNALIPDNLDDSVALYGPVFPLLFCVSVNDETIKKLRCSVEGKCLWEWCFSQSENEILSLSHGNVIVWHFGVMYILCTHTVYDSEDQLFISSQVGVVLHYSSLSTMLWLGVTARNIYKQVTKKPQQTQNGDPPVPPRQPLLR